MRDLLNFKLQTHTVHCGNTGLLGGTHTPQSENAGEATRQIKGGKKRVSENLLD